MKQFKNYDREFKSAKITHPEQIRQLEMDAEDPAYDAWPFPMPVLAANGREVDEAVYGVDCRDWQKFRVSLKGLPTRVKIMRLTRRWIVNEQHRTSLSLREYCVEQVRMQNYIGALRRGGLLDRGYRVVK